MEESDHVLVKEKEGRRCNGSIVMWIGSQDAKEEEHVKWSRRTALGPRYTLLESLAVARPLGMSEPGRFFRTNCRVSLKWPPYKQP